jgi:hypothetical protein
MLQDSDAHGHPWSIIEEMKAQFHDTYLCFGSVPRHILFFSETSLKAIEDHNLHNSK